jgi:hypothetical protein
VDNRFVFANIQTEEQTRTVRDMGIITNVLEMQVITVKQKAARFKSCQGVKVCRFKKKSGGPARPDESGKDQYNYWIEGGKLNFIPNPYGAGNVVFLIDDQEPVPAGSKSGAHIGYNRDFLASHYGEGIFAIDDPEIDAEIKARYENILKKLDEERPMQDARTARVAEISKIEENKRKGITSIAIVNQTQGTQAVEIGKAMPGPIAKPDLPEAGVAVDEEKEALKRENEELRRKMSQMQTTEQPADPQQPADPSAPEVAPEPKVAAKKAGRPKGKKESDKSDGGFAS